MAIAGLVALKGNHEADVEGLQQAVELNRWIDKGTRRFVVQREKKACAESHLDRHSSIDMTNPDSLARRPAGVLYYGQPGAASDYLGNSQSARLTRRACVALDPEVRCAHGAVGRGCADIAQAGLHGAKKSADAEFLVTEPLMNDFN